MDVNDNFRGWDDDLVAGTVHPIELFEFFYTLREERLAAACGSSTSSRSARTRSQAATSAIDFLKAVQRALAKLDIPALRRAQESHDAITALSIAQKALFSSY